jgi:two-component system LytT family sensor kinase
MPTSAEPTQIPTRRWVMWWSLSSLWWLLQGVTNATTYRGMAGVTWERALNVNIASALLWIPFTVLALWMAERWPLERETWKRRLIGVVLAALAVVVLRGLLVVWLNFAIAWYTTLPSWGSLFITSFANNFFTFGLLVAVGHAVLYARRISERDQQLARAELQHLKAQLHPHFLFNALNAISSTIRTDPELATRMISQLSVVLRHAIQRVSAQEVPLEEELQLLTAYVEIEQLRFEDRLLVQWQISPGTTRAMVPHLLLQPLVENAIRHGIAPSAAGGTVEIGVERREGMLHLSVRDNGVGWRGAGAPSQGIGLSNTRERLRQLYGASQSLQVQSTAPHGLRVDIVLPFREAVPA